MVVRILNGVIIAALLVGAGLLLMTDGFFLPDRWNVEQGLWFAGASRLLLATALVLLAGFVAAIFRGVVRASVPRVVDRAHGTYLLAFLVILACFLAAFLLADRVPNPALFDGRPPL